jgi:hypothetical protein
MRLPMFRARFAVRPLTGSDSLCVVGVFQLEKELTEKMIDMARKGLRTMVAFLALMLYSSIVSISLHVFGGVFVV